MNKLFITLMLMFSVCSTALGATCSAVSVMPSGGDYGKLSDAVAYLQANCATLSAPSVITISGSWSSADTTAVSISGIGTSSTNTLTVTTTGSARHDGTVKSGAYKLSCVLTEYGSQNSIRSVTNYTTIDGLMLTFSSATGDWNRSILYMSGDEIIVKNNVVYGTTHAQLTRDGMSSIVGITTTRGNYWSNAYIYNNVVFGLVDDYNVSDGGVGIYNDDWEAYYAYAYNNTVYGCNYRGIRSDSRWSSHTIKNNISYENLTDYYYNGTLAASSNNLSKDTSSPDASYRSKALTFANTGSQDFHLASGDTDAIDAGASLGSPYNVDIIGTSRPQGSAWDIGAFEYVASGGGGIPVSPYWKISGMKITGMKVK